MARRSQAVNDKSAFKDRSRWEMLAGRELSAGTNVDLGAWVMNRCGEVSELIAADAGPELRGVSKSHLSYAAK